MKDLFIKFTATFFGAGYSPKAPGTMGSILGVGLVYLLPPMSLLVSVAFVLLFSLGSVWISFQAEKVFGEHDCQKIVIDEVAGILVTFIAIPLTWTTAILGCALFRLFDILKPPPIKQSQHLPGGWGVVIDDVLAGVLANICLHLVIYWLPL